jgi:hypothetical protein
MRGGRKVAIVRKFRRGSVEPRPGSIKSFQNNILRMLTYISKTSELPVEVVSFCLGFTWSIFLASSTNF